MTAPGPRPIGTIARAAHALGPRGAGAIVAGIALLVASASGLSAVLPGAFLAGLLLTWMLGTTGRRVVAVLLAVLGAAMAAAGVAAALPGAEASASPWADWAFATLGVAAVAASVWLAVNPGERRRAVSPARAEVADTLASWKAMDAGLDPTDDRHEQELP